MNAIIIIIFIIIVIITGLVIIYLFVYLFIICLVCKTVFSRPMDKGQPCGNGAVP